MVGTQKCSSWCYFTNFRSLTHHWCGRKKPRRTVQTLYEKNKHSKKVKEFRGRGDGLAISTVGLILLKGGGNDDQ